MKYFLSACYTLTFLLLFSCDEGGGELPSSSQKGKTFLQSDEAFKEFLIAESSKKFSDINSGLNFGGSEQGCSETSYITINNTPYTLSSYNCYYYNEEENFERFSIWSSAFIDQNLILYVYAHFRNMGIPQTGTYNEFICNNDYCYSAVSLGAYVIDSQNEIDQYYYVDEPEIDVVNRNGVVTATFEEVFYDYYNDTFPGFTASGSMSCCN